LLEGRCIATRRIAEQGVNLTRPSLAKNQLREERATHCVGAVNSSREQVSHPAFMGVLLLGFCVLSDSGLLIARGE
jgi:hypothetical protein